MKIGHFEITKNSWKYKGMAMKKPVLILWSLLLLAPYIFFLFGLALIILLSTFDKRAATDLIDEYWPF